jgi:hypothetical protein
VTAVRKELVKRKHNDTILTQTNHEEGARDLALRPPGSLLRKVPKPARKGNHEVDRTTGLRPPSGRFLLFGAKGRKNIYPQTRLRSGLSHRSFLSIGGRATPRHVTQINAD